jgi:predicted negative regulator of RcsB-dependent stress response
MNQWWIISLALALSGLMTFTAGGQESQSAAVRCIVEPSSSEILPFEPLYLMISLVNERSKPSEVEISPHPLARIGTLDKDQINWTEPFAERAPSGPPLPRRRITLIPNERLTFMRKVHYEAPLSRRALVQKPGVVYIQGIIYADDRKYESEPVMVTIRQPQGTDAEAYEYLRTKNKDLSAIAFPPGLRKEFERSGRTLPDTGLYELFYWETVYNWDYGREAIEELLKFAARFPSSRYAQYARLGAGFIHLYTQSESRDLKQAANLFQEVGRTTDDTLAARASYYLGKTAEAQGNPAEAEQHYARSLSLKGDPYFKSLAEQAQVKIKQRRPPKQQ